VYFLLGISLILAFILIVNVAAAALASLAWRGVFGRLEFLSPAARARVIIGLRVMPVVLALVFVTAFVAPAYLLLEPFDTGETVSVKMAAIAIASSLAVLVAVLRVLQTWWATRSLLRNWLSDAAEISVDGIDDTVYRIEHPFPIIGVIGVFRPRVFIAQHVLDALDDHELAAAIEHENGHRMSYDNLKRGVMRMCRDLVILPIGKRLDAAWAETAESAADEFAARRDPAAALDLASALVKIAKLVPPGMTPALPAGAYLVEKGDEIASRVERLVALTDEAPLSRSRYGRFSSLVIALALAAIVVMPVADPSILDRTHGVVETFVSALQ
jgi:Zn-dependent protease with chaperone function